MRDIAPDRPTLGVELTPEVPIPTVVDRGVIAEDAGYDGAFISCHYNNRDPFAALARLAGQTDTLHIGPGVANPYELHPVTLASKTATVAELTNGRALFGIGPGDPSTLQNLGLTDERGLRSVLEAFKSAEDLWAGERITHEGTFEANDAGLNFSVPGEIPVYIGGEGPHMCRMSGKHADGLLFNGSHPADLAWASDRVAEGIEDRPSEYDEFELLAYASVSVADDAEAAREAARPPVAYITAGAAPPVLDRHNIDASLAKSIGKKIGAGDFSEAFEAVTPKMIDAFCIAGDLTAVTDQIADVLEQTDGIIIGSPIGPTPEQAIELAATAFEQAH
ncbi:5,10-methylenetetrahydromethanopterin reductase [Haloquadratum walsbyi]|uniref:5,10-methylenetetrahydromethanopterin reductase n=1 Tax=Haloquadratum walsbyi (strain DSM 16854 / JCM 12705 / C23) TaxID=768065 RepID=G0LMW7_HALWC|nr:5,10-methylenetetrahydromethanopterin reductase [Haloquadratum walsbyi]CCC41437.1 probable 5,10-methylenetetrahydrofolate reductase [Haloquadratum walsbyi C23]